MALGVDPHSYANFDQVKALNYDLVVDTDFQNKVFKGYVDITVEVVEQGASHVLFDTNNLVVSKVVCAKTQAVFSHSLTSTHQVLGTSLKVDLPADHTNKVGNQLVLRVHYETTPHSAGIQWFEPEQTQGKVHPYVYTQCEAILARTLLPCQDTPSVKCPYQISITVPMPLTAACSGTFESKTDNASTRSTTLRYVQKLPIPTYLIAIVAGDLHKASIGPRSSVWTEKEWIERAVFEFSADTEQYIQAGEALTKIPYTWGVYDVVVLPSAFPFGGMENPQLTFLSSSLLAGDRSLTNVVAHEIAHSWAGNWVTNSNWNDFWLNEGFCVYLERLILGKLHSQEYRFFEMSIGYQDLIKTVTDIGPTHEYTKLVPNLVGVDPDDAFSKIPYEKGSLFLFYLEQQVGGHEAMLEWIHAYYTKYEGKSINTAIFKADFIDYFTNKKSADLSAIDWESWFHKPGMPPFDPTSSLQNSLSQACAVLANKWIKEDGAGTSKDDLKGLKSKQVMYFMDIIITTALPLPHPVIDKLNETYGLTASGNVEIGYRFLMICLKSGYKVVYDAVAHFLSQHGRGLYVRPLYRALADLDRDYAFNVFQQNRSRYHGIIRNAFDKFFNAGVTIVP